MYFPSPLEQRRPTFHHCSSFYVAPLSGLTRSRTSNDKANSTSVEFTLSVQQPTWGAFSASTRKNRPLHHILLLTRMLPLGLQLPVTVASNLIGCLFATYSGREFIHDLQNPTSWLLEQTHYQRFVSTLRYCETHKQLVLSVRFRFPSSLVPIPI